ncbi:MAG: Peptidase [Myxococcaceae bacterium]|nr:Peptidase [Myxococcaceae bacterium]
MKPLVEQLCSRECAGRAPGTPGGLRARSLIRDALREAGTDPIEQAIGASKGANLVATLPGDTDRWVLVAAHYDHLGANARTFFPGADDNAAAVAILVEVARALAAKRADGRGVILAAFDAEEPPYFLTGQMGSTYFADHARSLGIGLDAIDLMVCMDLVGHALGPEGLPDQVRSSLFALGAERSTGTSAIVDELASTERGLVVRRVDAEVIPPLSDYDAFWKREVPFLFLTSGRSQRYHTPEDTPEHLDWAKMSATARWLEAIVRRACARPEDRVAFDGSARDDASTLRTFLDLVAPLAALSPMAAQGQHTASELLAQCDARGRLPDALVAAPRDLVAALESGLA